MPMPKKGCKYCGQIKPNHWPYQCINNHSKQKKNISRSGKHTSRWSKVRRQWFRENRADNYNCYICGKYMFPMETTLDHIIPRSRRPDLRYDFSNLRPCCLECNNKKGSKVY